MALALKMKLALSPRFNRDFAEPFDGQSVGPVNGYGVSIFPFFNSYLNPLARRYFEAEHKRHLTGLIAQACYLHLDSSTYLELALTTRIVLSNSATSFYSETLQPVGLRQLAASLWREQNWTRFVKVDHAEQTS